MAHIELALEVADDLDRIMDHLLSYQADEPTSRIQEIIHGIDALQYNPRIGRPTDRHMRELMIGRDAHGYVVLYRYIAEADTVLVLAIRNQREAGYARP